MKILFQPFYVGEQKPVNVIVHASDWHSVTSATCVIQQIDVTPPDTEPPAPLPPPFLTFTCAVENTRRHGHSLLASPALVNFTTPGRFLALWQIVWDDGQVDESVVGNITVLPVPG